MRKSLVFISIIFFIKISFATDWFPVGAKWTWDYKLCCPPELTTQKWQITKDTLIGSNTYHILTLSDYRFNTQERITIKEENKKVFRLYNNQLLPVCDFTKIVNDTAVFIAPGYNTLDTFLYVIDSIKPLAENQLLNIQYGALYYKRAINFVKIYPMEIIEKTLFFSFKDGGHFLITDGAYDISLRCYRDNVISFNSSGLDCDTVLLKAQNKLISRNLPIKIYPNPTSDKIQIEFSDNNKYKNVKLVLTDVQGKVMQSVENDKRIILEMNVTDYNNGLYFLKILCDDEFVTKQIQIYH